MSNETEKRQVSPTDSLANERTFLAWIRTAIAIMAFGFVAVKFSLFLDEIAIAAGGKAVFPESRYPYLIGVIMIVLAIAISVLAFLRYRQVERQLADRTYRSGTLLISLITLSFLFVSVLLLIYLLR